jgi:hypothetical protein
MKIQSGLIAAAAAAADSAATGRSFAGEVGVLGHRLLQRVEATGHDWFSEIAAFERFHSHKLVGATGHAGKSGRKAEPA